MKVTGGNAAQFFRANSRFLRAMPEIIVPRRLSDEARTSHLAINDSWATLACYSMLDERAPERTVRTTYRDMLQTLEFVRMGTDGPVGRFSPRKYDLVRQSLHRLYLTPVRLRSPRWERHVHVLDYYGLGYSDGVDTNLLVEGDAEGDKQNIGDPSRPIWSVRGRRPTSIEFRMNSELVEGLRGRGDRFALINRRVFRLRPYLGQHCTSIKLLFWLLGQPDLPGKAPGIGEAKLMQWLGLDLHNRGRQRQAMVEAIELLRRSGVIDRVVSVPYARGDGEFLRFEKSPDFFYRKALPPGQAGGPGTTLGAP